MRFLRENIFMVVLVAAVIAGAALFIPLGSSAGLGSGIESGKNLRTELDRKLEGVAQTIANQQKIKEEKQRIAHIKRSQAAVVDENVRWNHRNYDVPVVVYNTVNGTRRTPIFPEDTRLWLDYSLAFKAVVSHRDMLLALRDKLQPVQPYTQAELQAERDRLTEVQREAQKKQATEAAPEKDAPAATTGNDTAPGDAPPKDPILTANIPDLAQSYVVATKARDGKIYVAPGVIESHALEDRAKPDDVYLGVVKYWIIGDIVRTINEVNARAAEGAHNRGISNPGVPDLPVKELLRFVLDTYGVRPPQAGFTARSTGKDYTVVHYGFTVVMPLAAVPEFQQRLMAQNLHTVLDFQASNVEPSRERYYGSEPVMKVTFRMELLLLADWERGNTATSELTGPEDIRSWVAFSQMLQRQIKTPTPNPGKHIWELLTNDEKRTLLSAQAMTTSDQTALVRRFNDWLRNPDFYSEKAWQDVPLNAYLQSLQHRIADGRSTGNDDLVEFNRGAFHAAFPDIVTPSPHYPPLVPVSALEKLDKAAMRPVDLDRLKQAPTRP